MFKQVNVPVLGIVENMSYFLCPHCGTRSDIFGHGGARHEAERLGVPFLGEVPLHMAIRETSDAGLPVVASEPDGPHATIYRAIAAKVRDQLQGAIAAAEERDPRFVRLSSNRLSVRSRLCCVFEGELPWSSRRARAPRMTRNSPRRRTCSRNSGNIPHSRRD